MKRNSEKPFQNRTATSASGDPETDDSPATPDEARGLRALTVLELLAQSAQPQSLAQLAHRMHVPKTTLMRLLAAMEQHGYVQHTPAERGFIPGPRANGLALMTLRGPTLLRECRVILRALVQKLGETCNLTVPDMDRVLYVDRVETNEALRLHFTPGTRVPIHCTASGKLFLASLSRLERQRTLAHLPLTRASPHTITDRQALDAELDRIAQRGIGVDNEEFIRGMVAVAVPVTGPDGKVAAAVACHAPTARISLEELLTVVPHLRSAAEAMRTMLFPAT